VAHHILTSLQIEKAFPISEADRVAMESGKYFLNLHIVTGRKPLQPRPGDMLIDGTRQGMGDPYSDMTHYPLTRATHWERFAKYKSPRLVEVTEVY
jgi:hypothetical protein